MTEQQTEESLRPLGPAESHIEAFLWNEICNSGEQPAGPCTEGTLSPWVSSFRLYHHDISLDEKLFSRKSLSLIKVSVALFPSLTVGSDATALAVHGAILQLVLMSDSSHDRDQFAAIPSQFADVLSSSTCSGGKFDLLHCVDDRIVYILEPRASLFLGEGDVLDGVYEVYAAVLRPHKCGALCIGVTIDTAHVATQPQTGEFRKDIQYFPFRLQGTAREVAEVAQHVAEVTKTQVYTPPEGWVLDEENEASVPVRTADRGATPEISVEEDGTLKVVGTTGWVYWANAPSAEDRLQNGTLIANIAVPIRRIEPEVFHLARESVLRRIELCCCRDKNSAPTTQVGHDFDMTHDNLLMPGPGAEPPALSEAERAAAIVRRQLIRSLSLPPKGA